MLLAINAADPRLAVDATVYAWGLLVDGIGYNTIDGQVHHQSTPSDWSMSWSYWIGDGAASPTWAYSNIGVSDRVLGDGSWDAWSFTSYDAANAPITPPGEPVPAAPIPEPTTLLLLGMVSLGLRVRRRRQGRPPGVATALPIVALGLGAMAHDAHAGYVYNPDDFAVEVISASGPFGPSPYDDPAAILGRPATDFHDPFAIFDGREPNLRGTLIEAPSNTDADGNKLITTLNEGSQITVRMGRKVYDDPRNPYGIDLIVFGNAFFTGSGFTGGSVNLNTYTLSGNLVAEPIKVSVSPDGVNWYRYDDGPYADGLFPTNAYLWDRQSGTWTDELSDPTRPVNPALTAADFSGLTGADALDLYDGSAGGTGFDLSASGFEWIQYVRVEGLTGFAGGEIDAIAAVTPIPEPTGLALLALFTPILHRRRA